MPHLSSYLTLLERLQSQGLAVAADRCVRVRNRNAACARCAEACTSGCISVQGNGLSVDARRCIGCGTCAAACPTGALGARKPDDRALALQAVRSLDATGSVATFACAVVRGAAEGLFDPDRVVAVACLGRVEESLLVLLAALGATDLCLVHGDCERCEQVAGRAIAHAVRDTANTLLETWESTARVRMSSRFPAACRRQASFGYSPERRAFFSTLAGDAKDAAREAVSLAIDQAFDRSDAVGPVHVQADGALPRQVPERRALLLDMLERLGRPADDLIATRLWGHAVIDEERCDGCAMCTVFCPTGALTAYRGDEAGGLVHAPRLCVQCRCCEDICPRGALTLSGEVFAVDLAVGAVDRHPLRDRSKEKGGPDAIRNSMKKLIDSPYIWG